ncbi:hydrocephalus-inducing protein homolog, partial [Serinus canaria]|uniref:hydrocephalus-inducing protein homolog n=1 Tax=Serinus canaria TaxID=9135 RepID=UPI0021CC85C3
MSLPEVADSHLYSALNTKCESLGSPPAAPSLCRSSPELGPRPRRYRALPLWPVPFWAPERIPPPPPGDRGGTRAGRERGPRPARRHRPRPGPDTRVPRLPGKRGRGHSGCDGAAASGLSGALRQSWFGVSPPEIVFQNFVAPEVSEMELSLINKDKIPWLVKVCMESCPYFQLACPRDVYHVVPAGASVPVRIRFSPAENKDYCHELVCMTSRERIVVPIRAIGARAVLDFPAQLDFSKCAVKGSTQKTLLVHNVGTRAARDQLSTQ